VVWLSITDLLFSCHFATEFACIFTLCGEFQRQLSHAPIIGISPAGKLAWGGVKQDIAGRCIITTIL